MKPKGWLYCGGGCRQDVLSATNTVHWHRVYESCFEVPDGKEMSFIDWDNFVPELPEEAHNWGRGEALERARALPELDKK